MDNLAEEGIFRVMNYHPHPTNDRYVVIVFATADEADYFEELIKEKGFEYERDLDNDIDHKQFFAVRKLDFKHIKELIYLTHAKYRTPFISNVFLKWFLVIGVLAIIILSIIGYVNRN